MKLPNHLAGGTLITAILSSLSGINIFQSQTSIIVMLIATTLPDIDLPKSTIGRTFKPISLYINRRWGHRTITHSFITLLILTLLLAILEKQITDKNTLSLIFFYAYLSHLLLDMVTLMGVPLLYPFSKNPFVLPGNPRYRIRTGDTRAETIAFCTFILLSIFLRPLFEQGFWTSYNRLFGTMKHLAAEFKRSEDMLEVQYFGKIGTHPIQGKGLCIEANQNEVILIEDNEFTTLSKDHMTIDKVIPSHTNHQFTFTQIPIIALTIDSLNSLLQGQWIRRINLTSEQSFRVITNGIPTEQKRYQAELLTSIWFEELNSTEQKQSNDTFIYQPNPRIPILQKKLELLKIQHQEQEEAWAAHLQHIENLKQTIQLTNTFWQKERLYQLLTQAQKLPPPKINHDRELELQTEIRQLRQAQHLKNLERQLREANAQTDSKKAQVLSGSVTMLEIQ